MKIYVDKMPSDCFECPCWRDNINCNCGVDLVNDNNGSFKFDSESNCPLYSLSDYRKKVLKKIEFYNQHLELALKMACTSNFECPNVCEIGDNSNCLDCKVKYFLDQAKKQLKINEKK